MAKKKAASAATTATTAPVATKKPATKSAANGDIATAAGVVGADQIGLTAGAVWTYLNDQGETSLPSLKKGVDAPADLVLAAIGWLAREEKLAFTLTGKTVKVALK